MALAAAAPQPRRLRRRQGSAATVMIASVAMMLSAAFIIIVMTVTTMMMRMMTSTDRCFAAGICQTASATAPTLAGRAGRAAAAILFVQLQAAACDAGACTRASYADTAWTCCAATRATTSPVSTELPADWMSPPAGMRIARTGWTADVSEHARSGTQASAGQAKRPPLWTTEMVIAVAMTTAMSTAIARAGSGRRSLPRRQLAVSGEQHLLQRLVHLPLHRLLVAQAEQLQLQLPVRRPPHLFIGSSLRRRVYHATIGSGAQQSAATLCILASGAYMGMMY